MKHAVSRNSQAKIVFGMLALSFALFAMNRLHNDFLMGLGFGAGIGLLALGVRGIGQSNTSSPGRN